VNTVNSLTVNTVNNFRVLFIYTVNRYGEQKLNTVNNSRLTVNKNLLTSLITVNNPEEGSGEKYFD
jgi:hypothetical protein